jgi:hypothetical protein
MHLNNLITLTLRRSCQTYAESWPHANFQVQMIRELSVSMHTIPQHTVRCEARLKDDTQHPFNAFCYSCTACFMSVHPCDCCNPSLELVTKARTCEGTGQKWSLESHFMFLECGRVWKNEPPHVQISSHFRSWSLDEFLNF